MTRPAFFALGAVAVVAANVAGKALGQYLHNHRDPPEGDLTWLA